MKRISKSEVYVYSQDAGGVIVRGSIGVERGLGKPQTQERAELLKLLNLKSQNPWAEAILY